MQGWVIKPALDKHQRMDGGESVSIDRSSKEFCCRGEQRNRAASGEGRESQGKIYFRSGKLTQDRAKRMASMEGIALC